MAEPATRLSPDDCRKKARECRDLARTVSQPAHRALLEEMADTWNRLADRPQDSGKGPMGT
jgi:hypothetical protein